ncbi:hypothetical protein BJ912DRAFT_1064992 [Pholiota molesta]|nr:hypothetical protein BJ912DRAFT_1064992 [Pholiota molesta]
MTGHDDDDDAGRCQAFDAHRRSSVSDPPRVDGAVSLAESVRCATLASRGAERAHPQPGGGGRSPENRMPNGIPSFSAQVPGEMWRLVEIRVETGLVQQGA